MLLGSASTPALYARAKAAICNEDPTNQTRHLRPRSMPSPATTDLPDCRLPNPMRGPGGQVPGPDGRTAPAT
eukprot:1218015-Alexandrium_andersonii.AAC.1